MKKKKVLALLLSMSMVAGMVPTTAFAAPEGGYKPGVYTGSASVVPTEDDKDENGWEEYQISINVTIGEDGKINNVAQAEDCVVGNDNASYFKKALEGTKSKKGIADQVVAANGTEDVNVVSTATRSSDAIIAAINDALAQAVPEEEPEYTYLYAGLTWDEYWANEDVYAAGSTESSDMVDSRGEYDKGAFDVVSRATANHGLHRGSFQCDAMIYAQDGSTYEVSHWSADGKTIYLTDGTTVGWNRGTITKADGSTVAMDHYEVSGIKYVPVRVAAADLDAFCEKYATVKNGETLVGGYGENKLQAYELTAAVDANTQGLKYVTRDGDNFSFSEAHTGSGSGIADAELKTAEGYTVNVREGSDVGSYGEFLRVDINGNYGELGSRMQSVTWTYYGDDSTRTNAKAAFGTKFAADNWMHKSMGIQLGLTESARFALPENTDGTGYWTITVHALGYADTVINFEATSDNIAKHELADEADRETLQKLVDEADAKTKELYTEKSWKNLETEREETRDMLEKTTLYKAAAEEQALHLTEALNNLVGAEGYVLMNIPYAEFYAADVTNNVAVDTVSSATKNKTRTGTLVGGSYHVNSDGTDITGITYPVKVSDLSVLEGKSCITDESSVSITVTNRGKTSTTEYKGKDALFESGSYSYYILSEAPAYYKELTAAENGFAFGAAQGAKTEWKEASAELTSVSRYGDYQITVNGLSETGNVYAVVLETKEGASYGLRHLENVWRVSELAFCTGYTTSVHNCPTSSEHYKAIMGQTINKIVYYTENGIFTIDADLYVPIKTGVTASVEEGRPGDGSVKYTLEGQLPEGFQPVYSVESLDVEVKDGVLTYKNAAEGKYTLTISDASGVYAPVTANFEIKNSDAEIAAPVIAQINAIGTVTTGSEAKIKAARAAYDALTDAQKELVSNYKVLQDAEAAYKNLTTGVNGFVNRLYENILGRKADPAGFESWVKVLKEGREGGSETVANFVFSKEYEGKKISDKEFVTTMYKTILGRNPDQAGLDAWLGKLENGMTRRYVVAGFTNSQEFAKLCASYGIKVGSFTSNEIADQNDMATAFVSRLYTMVLGRQWDRAGLEAWTAQLVNHEASAGQISRGFFFSKELESRKLSNKDFVTLCYHTYLDRNPDQAGLDAWVKLLNEGISKEEILDGFINSPEFGKICAAYGIDR